jgi:hypothetical protein
VSFNRLIIFISILLFYFCYRNPHYICDLEKINENIG